jgi:predicted transcriptional regulator
MSIQAIISFFEFKGFKHIPVELRKLKKKDTTDHHRVKQFLLKLIRRPAFILPSDYQHIKSDDVYTLPSTIINEKLQQYMNITLNYANRWVDCCMVIFYSNNPSGIEQNYDGFMSYSAFVEGNIEIASSSVSSEI